MRGLELSLGNNGMTPPSSHLELVNAERPEPQSLPMKMQSDPDVISAGAAELARSLAWIPGQQESSHFRDRCETLTRVFRPLLAALHSRDAKSLPDGLRDLQANIFLLEGELQESSATFTPPHQLPHVRTLDGTVVPRISALARNFLFASSYEFTEAGFAAYIQAFQEVTVLKMAELWMLIPVMKLVLLEQIAERGRRLLQDSSAPHGVHAPVQSLQQIKQTVWKLVIEPLILFDRILREDPAGAYSQMDYETRDQYRNRLIKIAERCDCSEITVAQEALALAQQGQARSNENPRVTLRDSHIGTYFVAERSEALRQRVGFHPTINQQPGTIFCCVILTSSIFPA